MRRDEFVVLHSVVRLHTGMLAGPVVPVSWPFMNTSSHDLVTVDRRGFKAALVARAQAERVSVLLLVRSAVAAHLGLSAGADQHIVAEPISDAPVKLSIRLISPEAQLLAACARSADLSRGTYLAGLIAGWRQSHDQAFALDLRWCAPPTCK